MQAKKKGLGLAGISYGLTARERRQAVLWGILMFALGIIATILSCRHW